jgi:nucleotide-binding universal stress UspA family protein
MPIKDVLLHLGTYPDETAPEELAQAMAACAQIADQLTAIAFHVRIPVRTNALAEAALGLSGMARDIEDKSLASAKALQAAAAAQASAAKMTLTTRTLRAALYEVSDDLAMAARLHDLCVVPISAQFDGQRAVAEAVAFGSGRPVIVLPPVEGEPSPLSLDTVAVAWDGSRAAARALADALPILERAKTVRVVSILGDKVSVQGDPDSEILRHLAAHGVAAVYDEVQRHGDIGDTLEAYVRDKGVGLLVMGAYGHSRLREFVLGGATASVLHKPPCAVMLSH